MKVMVVHGPNLNLLGTREPDIYGDQSLEDINALITSEAAGLGIEIEFHQSQREGEIIELLQAGIGRIDGALLNPAAYSHTSRAIADTIRAVPYPVVEVHLSNIHAREEWRRASLTAEEAVGVVTGFGAGSYIVGLHALKRTLEA